MDVVLLPLTYVLSFGLGFRLLCHRNVKTRTTDLGLDAIARQTTTKAVATPAHAERITRILK